MPPKQARSNLRVCFDGAHRRSALSSGGVVVFAYGRDGCRKVLYRAGVFVGNLESAFLSEALSMEWALETVLANIVT